MDQNIPIFSVFHTECFVLFYLVLDEREEEKEVCLP